jgi:trimethylamine--corrinoid protein Co-methyltransferase
MRRRPAPDRGTQTPATRANNARPKLTLLSQEQIARVHDYALTILETVGVRVDSPTALAFLERKLETRATGDIIKFPRAVVEAAIASAPKTIDIFDRNGAQKFTLGADRLRFGIGVTGLFYQEPYHDNLEVFGCNHMRDMVRLGNALPLYDVVSTVGVVQDVPSHLTDYYGSLEMIANTTKPLVLLVSDENIFPQVLDMLEHIHGRDLSDRPFIIPYFNPVSPLVMNAGTADKIMVAAERGLPFVVSNYSMAGANTPLTPAGILALLLAELLAGLAIGQLVREGAPTLLGMLPVYFDMKTMMNFYDPQSILINIACAEIMAHYGLPHCGTSGSGTGWGMDLIAADTYWLNTLTFSLTKGGLAPFVGDTLGSKAISPLTLVGVHEIIDQALRFSAGFQLDDKHSVLHEIAEVGPGGHFLTTPSTLERYKDGYYNSRLFPHISMETWQLEGQPSADRVLREKTIELMRTAPPAGDHDEALARGEAWIEARTGHRR